MPHHHIYLVATIGFVLGNALHGLAQVNDIAQKNKKTWFAVLQDHWIPLTVRGVFSVFLFLALLEGQLIDALTAFHVPVPQGLTGLNLNSGPLAAVFGYAFDSALGYLPFIQKIGLPPAIDASANGATTPGAPVAPPSPPTKGA